MIPVTVISALFIGYASSLHTCDLPPSLWCSTPETAEHCKVVQQCKEYYTVKNDATPVNLTLYHESLCPDCVDFITTQLWKAFLTVPNIFTITMVPYGNAMEKKGETKYEFYCQHGKEECVGNVIESCVIYYLKDEVRSFNYSHCVAMYLKTKGKTIMKAAQTCADHQNIDFDQIMTCANGKLGNQLEHQMALRTNALNPPHKYVPWVTINGVHTEEIQKQAEDDLVKLLCDTYQGQKPDICQKEHIKRNTCMRKDF